jgi:glutathione synthase/RimK-type ligase-like ATP-grasp enzyme
MSTARRCAFLTMDDTAGWSIDADLGIPPLQSLGWEVDVVPWRSAGIDWATYAAVYVGTPWDYPDAPDAFLAALQNIVDAGPVLANPLPLIRWNLEKTYLRDLQQRGAAIVPTHWFDGLVATDVPRLHELCGTERIIVKPVISTNATDTFLLERQIDAATRDLLLATFSSRPCMVQPFIAAIQDEGEYSLFYIGGELSHTIQKTPRPSDFRVQEEHGASIHAVEPGPELRRTADALLALVQPAPLYARADFVRDADGRFLLMELELIEPSLYLRMHEAAPQRFALAFDQYVTAGGQE